MPRRARRSAPGRGRSGEPYRPNRPHRRRIASRRSPSRRTRRLGLNHQTANASCAGRESGPAFCRTSRQRELDLYGPRERLKMIELMFVACLAASAAECIERNMIYHGITPITCMMGAQAELARWAPTGIRATRSPAGAADRYGCARGRSDHSGPGLLAGRQQADRTDVRAAAAAGQRARSGTICGPRTRSRASSQPSITAPSGPRAL